MGIRQCFLQLFRQTPIRVDQVERRSNRVRYVNDGFISERIGVDGRDRLKPCGPNYRVDDDVGTACGFDQRFHRESETFRAWVAGAERDIVSSFFPCGCEKLGHVSSTKNSKFHIVCSLSLYFCWCDEVIVAAGYV